MTGPENREAQKRFTAERKPWQNQPARVSNFLPLTDDIIICAKGDVCNAYWLLKHDFVPPNLVKRIYRFRHKLGRRRHLHKPEMTSFYYDGVERLTFLAEIDIKNAPGDLRVTSVWSKPDGSLTYFDKRYIDWLTKNIPDCELWANHQPRQAATIKSRGYPVGLLMPVKAWPDYPLWAAPSKQ